MTTALDMIKRSLRMLGVYSAGETPSAEESTDALAVLNSMIEGWANESLLIYAQASDTIPLAAGVYQKTVGPTGDIVTARPVEVLQSSYILYQGVSYPLAIATLTDYNAIPVKTQIQGIPVDLYVLATYPNIALTLWPLPAGDMTLILQSNKQLQSFTSLTDVLTMPPGYERAIVHSLAEELGPDYQVAVSPDISRKASMARKALKRTNVQVPRLTMPSGIPMSNSLINWRFTT